MYSARNRLGLPGGVSPFGHPRISLLPATRGLSQAATSFIASRCQGIHHMLLVAWPKTQNEARISRKEHTVPGLEYKHFDSQDASSCSLSTTLAFNCQRSNRSPAGERVQRSVSGAQDLSLPVELGRLPSPAGEGLHPMVEMIGIEPTTSGLQSPRSPN